MLDVMIIVIVIRTKGHSSHWLLVLGATIYGIYVL